MGTFNWSTLALQPIINLIQEQRDWFLNWKILKTKVLCSVHVYGHLKTLTSHTVSGYKKITTIDLESIIVIVCLDLKIIETWTNQDKPIEHIK